MENENIDKAIKQAEANSSVENKKLDKKYLAVIKEALSKDTESFLENIYKLVKKENEDEKQRNK